MTRSQQLVRQLHLIASAVFGVFAVAVGLSGSALVFRDELERGFYEPRVVPGSAYLPLETLRADATAVEPTRRISMLILPDRPDRPVQFILQKRDARTLKEADQMSVYVNPYTGVIEGSHRREASLLGRLRDLHFAFFSGPAGLVFNGYVALALIFLSASGFVLWIQASPPKRRFRFSLRGSLKSVIWNLHRQTGLLSFALLILVCVTGAYYSFRDSYLAVIRAVTGSLAPRGAPPVPPAGPSDALKSIDQIAAAARAALPEGRLAVVRIPAKEGASWTATLHRAGDFGESTDSGPTVHLDPFTLQPLRLDDPAHMPFGARVVKGMEPVHYGKFGGLATRLLWFGLGLLPTGFALSGAWMWWNRTNSARADPTVPPQANKTP